MPGTDASQGAAAEHPLWGSGGDTGVVCSRMKVERTPIPKRKDLGRTILFTQNFLTAVIIPGCKAATKRPWQDYFSPFNQSFSSTRTGVCHPVLYKQGMATQLVSSHVH